MLDVLVAALVAAALVAAGLALLSALTLVPFVLALRTAEARGFDTVRWGAVALGGSLVGVAVVLLVLRGGGPPLLALVGVPIAFAGPVLLAGVRPGHRLGGRAGRHQ